LLASLERDAEAWEPVFSVAEAPGPGGAGGAGSAGSTGSTVSAGGAGSAGSDELADAGDWCRGFLAATDLAPADWAPLFDDGGEIGAGLATVRLLGEHEPGDGEADLDDPIVRDGLSRDVMDAVLALWARRRGPAA
jgi:hypothetical protein